MYFLLMADRRSQPFAKKQPPIHPLDASRNESVTGLYREALMTPQLHARPFAYGFFSVPSGIAGFLGCVAAILRP
jgi:hypothetical protein